MSQMFEVADVVILSTRIRSASFDPQRSIGKALVEARKTVIAVPSCGEGFTLQSEALILWDGSDEANAAMRAALPLLRQATAVTILEIDDGSLGAPARQARTFLAAHDIHAHARSDLSFGNVGSLILEQIELLKPGYVVMGGFGHSRWRERSFGGVTERLLRDCPVPILMKH